MQLTEFAEIMAFIEATCGKPLPKTSVKAYFECLKHLPCDVLRCAARKVVMEHVWATFPSVAELAQAASETARGVVAELSPAEAWEFAWHAASNMDLELQHSIDKACKNLPPAVLDAMKAFGLPALVYGKEPAGVIRGQFLKIYEQLAARDRRRALLPDALKKQIADIGNKMLPPAETFRLADIGNLPSDGDSKRAG